MTYIYIYTYLAAICVIYMYKWHSCYVWFLVWVSISYPSQILRCADQHLRWFSLRSLASYFEAESSAFLADGWIPMFGAEIHVCDVVCFVCFVCLIVHVKATRKHWSSYASPQCLCKACLNAGFMSLGRLCRIMLARFDTFERHWWA